MHRLLQRQLRRSFGEGFQPDEAMQHFLAAVDARYVEAEKDHQLMQNALLLNNAELNAINDRIRNQNAQLTRVLLNTLSDGVYATDVEGRLTFMNAAAEEMLGWQEQELMGRSVYELIQHSLPDGSQLPPDRTPQARVLLDGEPVDGTMYFMSREGAKVPVNFRASPIRQEGNLLGALVSFQDISLLQQAENKLRESYARLENTLRELEFMKFALDQHAIVSVTDAAGNITRVNRKFIEISGYTEEELLGKNHRILKSGMHPPQLYQEMWDTLLEGKTWHGEVCNRKKSGGFYWVEATIVPFLDASGLPERYISIRTDITPLKVAKERWAFAVEGAGDGVWDWNMETGEMSLSSGYETMLGYEQGEMTPSIQAWITGVHDDDLNRIQDELQHYLEGQIKNYQVELRLRCKDGGYKWILCRGQIAERNASGKPVRMIGIHTDISARKQAELALQESMQKFQRLVEDMGDQFIVYSHTLDGRLTYASAGIEAALGVRRENVAQRLWQELVDWDLESLSRAQASVQEMAEGKRDYAEFDVSFVHPNGGTRTLHVVNHPVRDDYGRAVAIEGVVHNITERVETEQALIRARDAAERANKAKSDFLSSMSHELRTPMNAILGFAQLMEADPECSPDQKENLQQILKAGWHLLDLINEVLDLARVESGQVKLDMGDIDPGALAAECVSLVATLATEKGIALESRMPVRMPPVRGDYMRVKQVLINLLSNAIKYNRDGGGVAIDASSLDDGTLKLSVHDTGRGMTADELEHLFEPFTRFGDTDKVHGTGIGLSISKKLIESMGGQMEVASTPGVGSVFSLLLPPAGSAPAMPAASEGGLSLLYIEDDPAQQMLMSKLAGKFGWRIEFGNDAPSGIEAAMQGRFDAILLDIELPGGFDGYEVKSILDEMESLAGVPVIGVSVHASQEDYDRAHQAGFAAYLAKPVVAEEIERTILQAIHKVKV